MSENLKWILRLDITFYQTSKNFQMKKIQLKTKMKRRYDFLNIEDMKANKVLLRDKIRKVVMSVLRMALGRNKTKN